MSQQHFTYQPQYVALSESGSAAIPTAASFSNEQNTLDGAYGDSTLSESRTGTNSHLQNQSSHSLISIPSISNRDLEHRNTSVANTSHDTFSYTTNNPGPNSTNTTSTPPPAFSLFSPLSTNISSLHLIQNPTSPSYTTTSNNVGSYSFPNSNSTHQSYPITTGIFTQPPVSHFARYNLSIPINSAMPPSIPPHHHHHHHRGVSFHTGSVGNEYNSPSYQNRTLQSNVNPFQLSSSPSPPLSMISRGARSITERASPSPSSTYGFGSAPMHLEIPTVGGHGQDVPPFEPTRTICQLTDEHGRHVVPEIQAKIDKGFFRAEHDWCCYRRNYFSVACSYKLTAVGREVDHEHVYLVKDNRRDLITGFYICIAAKVNGEDGRAIELVQHTAKRDKGPMKQPEKLMVKPNPGSLAHHPGLSTYGSPTPHHGLGNDYGEPYHLRSTQQNLTVAVFDRIQFKKATANNGKRRAAQQYFHVVVELFGKIQKHNGDEEFVKIAHRESDQMVVRGRSPGHYKDPPRGSSNMGGGTGAGAGGTYGPLSRDLGSAGLGQPNSLTGHNYSTRTGGYTFHSHPPDIPTPFNSLSPISPLQGMFSQPTVGQATPHLTMAAQFYGDATCGNSEYNSRDTTASNSSRSAGNTPSPYETPRAGGFYHVTPIKEDTLVKTEEKIRAETINPLQLPMVDIWGQTHDTLQPLKDCRPWQIETTKRYFPPMSAL